MILLLTPVDLQDFGNNVQASLDEVLYLVQLRDSEEKAQRASKLPDLKNTARFMGIKFKNNIKKADLVELVVHGKCSSLSCVWHPCNTSRIWGGKV